MKHPMSSHSPLIIPWQLIDGDAVVANKRTRKVIAVRLYYEYPTYGRSASDLLGGVDGVGSVYRTDVKLY